MSGPLRAQPAGVTTGPETPEPELTREQRRDERQRLKTVRRTTRRREVMKNAYDGKNRAKGKHPKGKKR